MFKTKKKRTKWFGQHVGQKLEAFEGRTDIEACYPEMVIKSETCCCESKSSNGKVSSSCNNEL